MSRYSKSDTPKLARTRTYKYLNYSYNERKLIKDPEALKGKNGIGYSGFQKKTRSGKTCDEWPNKYRNGRRYRKMRYLLRTNYCRNPNGEKSTIWCFVTDEKSNRTSTEYCDPQGNEVSEDFYFGPYLQLQLTYKSMMKKAVN